MLGFNLAAIAVPLVAAVLAITTLPWMQAVLFTILTGLSTALAIGDFHHRHLADSLVIALAGIGLAASPVSFVTTPTDAVIGGLAGGAAFWLVALGYRRFRGVDGLGFGDVKLAAAIGLWLGWQPLAHAVLLACALTAGHAVFTHRRAIGVSGASNCTSIRKVRFPLGAYLTVATVILWYVRAWLV